MTTGAIPETGDSSQENEKSSERIAINEAQLLLAEKRTSLAVMRTGITVFALPISVLSVLVATSRYYDFNQALPLLLPLLVLCAGLVVLGAYLTHRAVWKIRRYDRQIQGLKKKSKAIAEFVD
jgi:uncharacterized membrane protein YidH (DUF202 family)